MFFSFFLHHKWFSTDEPKHLVHQPIVGFLFFIFIHYCIHQDMEPSSCFSGIGEITCAFCSTNLLSLCSVPILVNILGLCLIKRKLWSEFPTLLKSVLKSICVLRVPRWFSQWSVGLVILGFWVRAPHQMLEIS